MKGRRATVRVCTCVYMNVCMRADTATSHRTTDAMNVYDESTKNS